MVGAGHGIGATITNRIDNVLGKERSFRCGVQATNHTPRCTSSAAPNWDWLWWTAIGNTLYVLIYPTAGRMTGLVHQRYWKWVPRKGYAKRLVQRHKLHHSNHRKEGGVQLRLRVRAAISGQAEGLNCKAQKEAGIAVVRDSGWRSGDGFETVGPTFSP